MAEGVDSLTPQELFTACQARGMCTLDVTPDRMKSELAQWLELHLTHSIPSTLLILSRAFSFSQADPTPATTNTASAPSPTTTLSKEPPPIPIAAEVLQATLSSLPETLVSQTKIRVSELGGSPATAEQKLDVLKQQEELIAKEKEQEDVLKAVLTDSARLSLTKDGIAHDLNAMLEVKSGGREGGRGAMETALPLPLPHPANQHWPLISLQDSKDIRSTDARLEISRHGGSAAKITPNFAKSNSELLTDAQVTVIHASTPHAVVPHGDDLAIEALEDSRLTKQQLLELREALGIMSSRSGVLEEREKLEALKKHRVGYKEVKKKKG